MEELRNITENEIDEFINLRNYSFLEWTNEIEEKYRETIELKETFGLFKDGKLLASLRNLRFKQAIRGCVKNMGGISSVGCYPEGRRKGYISKLMDRAFIDMKENDMPVSMLAAFKDTYYAKYGYVKGNSNLKLLAPMHALQHYIKYELPGDWSYERYCANEVKDDYIKYQSKTAPSIYNGIVIQDIIPEKRWRLRNEKYLVVFVKKDKDIVASAMYGKKGFLENGVIDIHELYWSDIEARNMLFKFFSLHIEQINKISLMLPYGINFQNWFEGNLINYSAELWGGSMMVRIIDVENAITDLPATLKGNITINVKDEQLVWNNNTYKISGSNDKLSVVKSKENSDIDINIMGLTALVYGTLDLAEIELKGWINIKNDNIRDILVNWFPEKGIYNSYQF